MLIKSFLIELFFWLLGFSPVGPRIHVDFYQFQINWFRTFKNRNSSKWNFFILINQFDFKKSLLVRLIVLCDDLKMDIIRNEMMMK
jgi:hypothetical protein